MTDDMRDDALARLDRLEVEFERLRMELVSIRSLAMGIGQGEVEAVEQIEPLVMPPEPVVETVAASVPPPAPVGPRPMFPPPSAGALVREERAPAPPPARPPEPPRRSLGELAREWDLVGARGFAIAGGAVMALGIGFFFVLAANRGWIDERARVALGAAASTLVLCAGLLLRARYGQYWSALAAVAAGLAGAYATLAAAAARYDLVPDALALPLAGVIAAVGAIIGLRWGSQVIAAIGLLGAALAPALQALDTALTWESVAFALIVLAACAAMTVPRGWPELLLATSVIVGGQVEWLAGEMKPPAGAGTVAVVAALPLVLLGISIGLELVRRASDLDPLALTYALVAFATALQLTGRLFEERTDRGAVLLGAAAIWAVVFGGLQWRRRPDLGLVVGTSALALAAVATALLLSDAALTIAWAAQAVVLAVLASRFHDVRLQAMGITYAALASAHALGTDGTLGLLFDEQGDQLAAVAPVGAAAVAFAAAGVFVPSEYRERTEAGLLAFVGDLRRTFAAARRGLREAFLFAGAALATLAASLALVAMEFDWGHVAASLLAAAGGAVSLGIASKLRSDPLVFASFVWLGVVLVEALAFDAASFWNDESDTSIGGWSVIAASAGLLGGAYALRVLQEERRLLDVVAGIAVGVAFMLGWTGIAMMSETERRLGIGLLMLAAVYVALAAGVFRRDLERTFSTTLWSFGLVALVTAEAALVTDSVWRTVTIALTALAVGVLARPLGETRLWLAGGALAVATTGIVLLVQVQPWLSEEELDRKLAVASGACLLAALGLAALRFRETRWRDLVTVLWATGVVALLATERVVLGGWEETAFAVALTGGVLALLARPLGEERLWLAGGLVAVLVTVTTITELTPLSHFFRASESPADGIGVLIGCVLALVAVAVSAPDERYRVVVEAAAGGLALYALSLGILEVAMRVSTASLETDFERGHTAVSGLWALVGLALLVLGLLRGSAVIRYAGLVLFGLSLAKIFLYDLAELSSVARAFSFILVGGLLLAGGFFLQRLSDRIAPRS